jgi:hypothetical protein
VIVAPARIHGVVAQERRALGERRVVRHDRAALAGGDDLVPVEGEGADAPDGSHAPPLVPRPVGLGGVLDDLQTMLGRHGEERVHVDRVAVEVDRDDCAGPRGQLPSRVHRVDAPRLWFGIDQHGDRPREADDVGRRDEGQVRDQDLVARPDPERGEAEVKRGGAVRRRHRMTGLAEGREVALEALHVLAEGRDPAGVDAVEDVAPHVLGQPGSEDWDHRRSSRTSATAWHT